MPSTTLDFTGQKVIVIGGTSDIGLAVARRVLEGGGSAVVTGRTEHSAAETVADLAPSGDAVGLAADLSDHAAVNRLRGTLTEQHADATLLVNAAGIFEPKTFLEHPRRLRPLPGSWQGGYRITTNPVRGTVNRSALSRSRW